MYVRERTQACEPIDRHYRLNGHSFYSGAVNIGHLNLGLLHVVGNAMQIVGLH